MSYVRMGIQNYKALEKAIEAKRKAPKTVMKRLTADAKKRVPGWVATEVTKVYGIKKAEITGQKVGTIKTKGSNIKDLKFIFTGRMLTPTHFSMSPKTPPGGAYTLKAAIIKGQRKPLGKVKKLTKKQKKALTKNFTRTGSQSSTHSPIMLMRANGGQYLPFQRKSTNRKDVEAIKTVSLPQMVSSERTAPQIRTTMNTGLQKRLDHYLERYMGVE